MRVGVKFCGHCSPQVDMAEVLKVLAQTDPALEFVGWENSEYAALLVLNGCSTGCATRPPFAGPVLWVTDVSINGWPIEKSGLCTGILQKLQALKDYDRRVDG